MKKRILFAISTLLVLGLAIAAFALSGNSVKNSAMDCCANCCAKSGDSCPMKNKDKNASATEKASCCDKDDCCCKGDACPMMKKEGQSAEHENCPMMKKDKKTASTTVEMKNVVVVSDGENCCGTGADCCKGGGSACCKGKHG